MRGRAWFIVVTGAALLAWAVAVGVLMLSQGTGYVFAVPIDPDLYRAGWSASQEQIDHWSWLASQPQAPLQPGGGD